MLLNDAARQKKLETITKLERASKFINGSKFLPYSESFKKALMDESLNTLNEDLELAKKKMLDADPFLEEPEMEEYLKAGN